jgi:hypothetical protein
MKYIINIKVSIDEEVLNDPEEALNSNSLKGSIITITTPAKNEAERLISLI